MRAEQSKFLGSVNSAEEDSPSLEEVGHSAASSVDEPQESTEDICSLCHDSISSAPHSFLILLQVKGYHFCAFFSSKI